MKLQCFTKWLYFVLLFSLVINIFVFFSIRRGFHNLIIFFNQLTGWRLWSCKVEVYAIMDLNCPFSNHKLFFSDCILNKSDHLTEIVTKYLNIKLLPFKKLELKFNVLLVNSENKVNIILVIRLFIPDCNKLRS